MPYGETEIPENVKNAPKAVQDIYRAAFNREWKKNPDEAHCARIAWGAVKNAGWEQDEKGKWHKTMKAEAVYRKEVLKPGVYCYPGNPDETIDLNTKVLTRAVENTRAAGIRPFVPLRHSENPMDNVGYAEPYITEDGALWADLRIGDEGVINKLDANLIPDVSIGLAMDYVGSDGTVYDYAIQHIGLVSDPHAKGLSGFIKAEGQPKVIEFAANQRVDPNAEVRNRGKCALPAESPNVTDKQDHFPINDEDQARNALARVAQLEASPDWYSGTLKELQVTVQKAVSRAYKGIEVTMEANMNLAERIGRLFGKRKMKPKGGDSLDFEAKVKELEDAQKKQEEETAELKVNFEAVTKERDELKAKIDEQEAEKKKEFEAETEAYVNGLIEDKKITPADKDKWVKFYAENPELCREVGTMVGYKAEAKGKAVEENRPGNAGIDDPEVRNRIAMEARTEAAEAGKANDLAFISDLMIAKVNAEVNK